MVYDISTRTNKHKFRAIRNWFYFIYSFILSYSVAIKGQERTSVRDQATAKEIRDASQRKNGGPKSRIESSTANKSVLRKREEEYLKELEKIRELKQRIEKSIQESYVTGSVNVLPRMLNTLFKISDGWLIKLIHHDDHKDLYHVECKNGKVLRSHNHKYIENIHVIEGSIRVTINKDKPNEDVRVLKENDSLTINQYIYHEVKPLDDCELVVTFKPPISVPL